MNEATSTPLVYVGPPARALGLNTFGIFADGIPTRIAGTTYEKLFVPAADLEQARHEVGMTGSAMNVFYKKAQAESSKGGKK